MDSKRKKPVLHEKNGDCCACTVCSVSCPKGAITFKRNTEGFSYPEIDMNKCIGCLRCETVCAFKKDKDSKWDDNNVTVYAAKSKERSVIENSSSGGVFTVLSDYFIENGDAVGSCIYDASKKQVRFEIYETKRERDRARGSKYIQAEIGNTYSEVIKWLKENVNKKMLVVGTGCQIAGLNELLYKEKVRNQVILVDLICHGVPSPGLWEKYVEYMEKQNGIHIEEISFKDKRDGWKNPYVYAKSKGREVSIKPFADWFYCNYSVRESCYECPYTRVNRRSDITIGDYWGIENILPKFYDPMGVSLVLVQSKAGKKLIQSVASELNYVETDTEKCLQPRLISPAEKPPKREKFWTDLEKKGLAYCIKNYKEESNNSVFGKAKRKIKNMLAKKKGDK